MIDFSTVKNIIIPEGKVKSILRSGVAVWSAETPVEDGFSSIYQEVEWIQADANVGAYLDLGFSYDKGAVIYLGQWVMNDNTAYPFGAAENSGKLRCMVSSPYGNKTYIYGSDGNKQINMQMTYVKNKLNDFVFNYKVGNWYNKNLTNGYTNTASTLLVEYTMSSNLYLFAQNYNGSARFGDIRRISYFQYYNNNDELICNLVPCYRKSDGVIGMYDVVRETFLINAGSGTFTKGADVVSQQ